jgi:hypothetical protein
VAVSPVLVHHLTSVVCGVCAEVSSVQRVVAS